MQVLADPSKEASAVIFTVDCIVSAGEASKSRKNTGPRPITNGYTQDMHTYNTAIAR